MLNLPELVVLGVVVNGSTVYRHDIAREAASALQDPRFDTMVGLTTLDWLEHQRFIEVEPSGVVLLRAKGERAYIESRKRIQNLIYSLPVL